MKEESELMCGIVCSRDGISSCMSRDFMHVCVVGVWCILRCACVC